LALQILALQDDALKAKLNQYRSDMAQEVLAKDKHLQEVGAEAYLSEKGQNK